MTGGHVRRSADRPRSSFERVASRSPLLSVKPGVGAFFITAEWELRHPPSARGLPGGCYTEVELKRFSGRQLLCSPRCTSPTIVRRPLAADSRASPVRHPTRHRGRGQKSAGTTAAVERHDLPAMLSTCSCCPVLPVQPSAIVRHSYRARPRTRSPSLIRWHADLNPLKIDGHEKCCLQYCSASRSTDLFIRSASTAACAGARATWPRSARSSRSPKSSLTRGIMPRCTIPSESTATSRLPPRR
jgi:hypothetical protein